MAILGWAAARVVSPAERMRRDAVTSFTHKDLASASRTREYLGGPNFVRQGSSRQELHSYIDQGRAVRRAIRTELLRAVVVVERPASTSTNQLALEVLTR